MTRRDEKVLFDTLERMTACTVIMAMALSAPMGTGACEEFSVHLGKVNQNLERLKKRMADNDKRIKSG